MRRKIRWLVIIISLQLTIGLLGGTYLAAKQYENTILPGTRIQNIPVGGLNKEQAVEKIKDKLSPKDELILKAGEKQWAIPYSEIDAEFDYAGAVEKAAGSYDNGSIPVARGFLALKQHFIYKDYFIDADFNKDKLLQSLTEFNEQIRKEPQRAKITLNNNNVEITDEKKGLYIDFKETLEKVENSRCGIEGPVQLAINTQTPDITASNLESIDTVLGKCETSLKEKSRNSLYNIKKAANDINHVVIPPGEVLSFNEQTGEKTKTNGYKDAPVFSNNEVTMGPGGGVCQVSTTLYNAALLANLEIIERHPHSKTVGYASPGLDATVAYGIKDLKFKNNTEEHIYIISSIESEKLSISILGSASSQKEQVKLITEADLIEPNMIIQKTSSLKEGEKVTKKSGERGYKVKVYRVIKEDDSNKEERNLVSSDYYPPEQGIMLVGLPEEEDNKK